MKLTSSQRWAIGAVLLTLLIACSRNPFEGPRMANAHGSGHAEASQPANLR
jgi:hypothetical protein